MAQTLVLSQTIAVKQDRNRIGTEKWDGHSCEVAGSEDDIEGKWYKYLRTIGRMREEGNYLLVSEGDLDAFPEQYIEVFSKLTPSDSSTIIWIGTNGAIYAEDSTTMINGGLKDFLYEFVLDYYQDKAQDRIDEAQRAVDFTVRKHQKLMNEEVELNKDLEATKAEIVRLQQLIESNTLQEEVIKQKIIDNSAEQDTTQLDIERLKKIVEKKIRERDAIE